MVHSFNLITVTTVVCKNNVSNAYVTGISKVKLTTSGTRKSLKMIGECAHLHCTCTIVIYPKKNS